MTTFVAINLAAMALIAALTALASDLPWQTYAGMLVFLPVFAVAFAAAIHADMRKGD